MARSDHQPVAGPVMRPERSSEEFRETCGTAAAFVLAHEAATTPLTVAYEDEDTPPEVLEAAPRPLQLYRGKPVLAYALEAAADAHVESVSVLAHPSIEKEVGELAAAFSEAREDAPAVEVVAYDAPAALDAARENAWFDFCDLGFGVLDAARACLARHAGAERVVVMRADAPRVTADHIFELCEDAAAAAAVAAAPATADAAAAPAVDAVCSWTVWLRRAPFVFERAFLEGLSGSAAASRGARGTRPVPRLQVRDHVFGEEMLAANDVVPEPVEAFRGGVRLAALQAVGLARAHRDDPDAPISDPNVPEPMAGPEVEAPLGAADALLEECAEQTLEALAAYEAALSPAEAEALEFADAFGARNRLDFPLLNDAAHAGRLAYLDTAATAQRLGAALDAQAAFDRHANANVYRGGYELSAKATSAFNRARKRLEDFIGAERRQTVYTANTTASCNLVASAWGEHNIAAGDCIVTTIAEHHSNMLPFLMLCKRKGAHMVYVPVDGDGRIDRDGWHEALEKHPKLACVAQVGNVFGMENPVAEMAAEAREAGARVLVDAAQSFAHLKIDVASLGADFLALSAHKAYGPMGLGALWVSDDAFAEMDPVGSGGGAVSHVSLDSWYLRQKAIQYEPGTPPVSQAMGFAAAVEYLDTLGMDEVAAHSRALTRLLADGLSRIEGVTVWGDHAAADGLTGLVSFTLYGVAPAQLAKFLGSCGVAIRSGGHCALPLHASMGLNGTGRASLGVYTTEDDVLALLSAVRACREVWWGRWSAEGDPAR